jgi:hypothetical protein
MALIVLAIGLSQDSKDSGATPPKPTARVTVAPEKCPDARKAVRFYGRKLGEWRVKMGAGSSQRASQPAPPGLRCPHVRRLAHTLQRKAHDARVRYQDWHYHEYRWDHWLPAKFYRVARCETGVRWDWDSGTYVSAFGIIRVAYEWYHPWTGHNSPREQYEVAAAIQRRFGWGAWGCGGA